KKALIGQPVAVYIIYTLRRHTMNQKGNHYFEDLELNKYGFSSEEKEKICEFYDLCKTNDYGIYPVSKSEFEEMQSWSEEFLPEICLLWTNRNSNYAGVYISGLLKGKVCIVDHEEEMYAPLFRSINSFITTIVSHKLDDLYNQDMLKVDWADYPSVNSSQAEKDSDLHIVKTIIEQINKDSERDYYRSGMIVCYLMPNTHLDLLKPFLYEENMWVQETACYVLAIHKYEPAIEWLKEISQIGKGNEKFAATRSLKYMLEGTI
ncbi:hypothetical protein, partial [Anaerosporobacter sp.]|uniref:hypothetical protein n=1 Tax=Anaerosporobacter sp. TaxID=1872529 RepID=UPI00286F3E3E